MRQKITDPLKYTENKTKYIYFLFLFYSKPSVTSTPCWIEIKLEAPLKWLDILLAEKGQPPSRCSSR